MSAHSSSSKVRYASPHDSESANSCDGPPRLATDLESLRCPTTGQPLKWSDNEGLVNADGSVAFPVLSGVPVLINERRSTFSIANYSQGPGPSSDHSRVAQLREWLDRRLPSLSNNLGSSENYELLRELLRSQTRELERPRVLIVGAGSGGVGSDVLADDPGIDCVETDVVPGPRIEVVCDAHDLPFADATFEAVVCQAVLEHVLDPVRVVEEIHRVLAAGGFVYSEVPFMQQVHGGAYDLTRFSLLGHRRLYRYFDEVKSGVQGGPGMALGWSLWYLLRSMARTRAERAVVFRLVCLTFFWLKYLDRWLIRSPAAADAASGTFFLGRRREEAVSDEAILASYHGAGSRRPGTGARH